MKNDNPQRPSEGEDIRADFDAEDEALWKLLGVVDDASPSRDFVARTLARSREDQSPAAPLRRGPWVWWSGGGAAAAALVGAVLFFGGGDDPKPVESRDESTAAVEEKNDISDVVDLLRNLEGTDLLALEADDAESVQDEYLGG